jgi:cytochrome c biogenesis protein CcmG/thiol:disulfide interchange protein DsbE
MMSAPARMAVAALLLTVAACDRGADQRASGRVTVGHPAPAYAARTLGGDTVSLAGQRGKVVLLNIWATWCKPCREEIPALATLHRRHAAEGLVIAGVSIDVSGDSAKIASFAHDLGANYTLWHDPDDVVSTTFLAIGVPASYLVGRDGTLRWRHVGPVTADDSSLNAALKAALAEAYTEAPDGG